MDFVNKLTNSEKNTPVHTMDTNSQSSTSNSGGGVMDKLHGMVGGGTQSEKNEDTLDKGTPPPSPVAYTHKTNPSPPHRRRLGPRKRLQAGPAEQRERD